MNPADLERILVIAETGSMTKASQQLFLTQPALSKCLNKIEEELGETLFVRRPTGLLLTYAGECFIKKAYQILKLYNDMEMEFCELNHMRKGVLKLGIVERLGALILPDILKRFYHLYPNIKVEIIEGSSFSLEEKVLMGALDIAILCLPLKNPNIKYQTFYEEPIYCAIPKEHPLNQMAYEKEGQPMKYLPFESLFGAKFILTQNSKKTRIAANHILEQLHGNYHIILELLNIETVIRLVANNMGISLIPAIFSKAYETNDRINYYMLEEQYSPTWQWAVIYSDPIDNLSRPSRELYDILCKKGFSFPDYIQPGNIQSTVR